MHHEQLRLWRWVFKSRSAAATPAKGSQSHRHVNRQGIGVRNKEIIAGDDYCSKRKEVVHSTGAFEYEMWRRG
ncbi:MAG: hypothetical protein KDB22_22165 [Planctomycetales bacterium]|nr:hypothetical protein [Planctomycetales bacterium]